jgi:hypothetical protein
MLTLEDAILKIRDNPIKYIGKKSLKRLDLFISGYTLSQLERDGKYQEFLDQYQKFLARKYNIRQSKRFSMIIQDNSASDEHAFEKFYELLGEFYNNQ